MRPLLRLLSNTWRGPGPHGIQVVNINVSGWEVVNIKLIVMKEPSAIRRFGTISKTVAPPTVPKRALRLTRPDAERSSRMSPGSTGGSAGSPGHRSSGSAGSSGHLESEETEENQERAQVITSIFLLVSYKTVIFQT